MSTNPLVSPPVSQHTHPSSMMHLLLQFLLYKNWANSKNYQPPNILQPLATLYLVQVRILIMFLRITTTAHSFASTEILTNLIKYRFIYGRNVTCFLQYVTVPPIFKCFFTCPATIPGNIDQYIMLHCEVQYRVGLLWNTLWCPNRVGLLWNTFWCPLMEARKSGVWDFSLKKYFGKIF
jgi:hypothetical protein